MLLWKRYGNNKMAAMRYYSTSSTVQSQTELVFILGHRFSDTRATSLSYVTTQRSGITSNSPIFSFILHRSFDPLR